jgi:predicted transcriptional regulator YdeE
MNVPEPAVVHFEGITVYGLRIQTTFASCGRDCPALWEKLQSLVRLADKDMYGASANMTPETFDYLAGVGSWPQTLARPEDFAEMELSAGMYARCAAPSLNDVMGAYKLLYEENWAAKNSSYTVNFVRPCFELYPAGYSGGMLYVYAPVDEKPQA